MKFLRDEGRQAPIAQSAGTLDKGDGRYTEDRAQPQRPARVRFAKLPGGEDGQTTVVMALFMATFLFGFVALGIDVEYLFHAKRMAQGAADAAALAAAEESSNGTTAEQAAANAMAKLNGFDTTLGKNPATDRKSTRL